MCWEDVRIWRSQRTVTKTVATSTVAAQILTANKDRIAIIVGEVSTNRVHILNDPGVIGTTGFAQAANLQNMVLHIKDYGAAIQDAWYAISSAGVPTVTITEVILTSKPQELIA